MQRGTVICPRSHSTVSGLVARLSCSVALDKRTGLQVRTVSHSPRVQTPCPPFFWLQFRGAHSWCLVGCRASAPPGSTQLPHSRSVCPDQVFPNTRPRRCLGRGPVASTSPFPSLSFCSLSVTRLFFECCSAESPVVCWELALWAAQKKTTQNKPPRF